MGTYQRMKLPFLLALALFLPACHWGHPKEPRKSVVKIFTTVQNVDFYEPWKPGSTDNLEGCGCILPGGQILTNAHLTDKANYIEVQKFGETKKYVAKVDKVGYDTDLALLTVEDKDFATGTVPVQFDDLPQPGDKLTFQGGDELSVKEDTVSGLDMVWSWEGNASVPALLVNSEIDSKINGCPVFNKDGWFVGIPFTSWHSHEKSGTILPVNMVQRFLRAVKNGRAYDGLVDNGFYCQNLESPALRDYYHVPPNKTGVVVSKVLYGGAADGLFKEGDVVTAIDGHSIDNDGYVQLNKQERVGADYLLAQYLPGESAEISFFRDGKTMKVKQVLKPIPTLVTYRADNRHPSYFMIAGFVFVPMTYNYLQSVDWNNLKPELKELYSHGLITPERKQVVLLSHVLPDDLNSGYQYFENIVVDKVNGHPIGDMKDLVAAFDHPQGGNDIVEFDDHAWSGSKIVFDATKAKKSTKEIMSGLNIPADRSDDLK
jgi:S1-C subfamily serine protease